MIEDDLDDQMFFKWALTLIAPSVECIIAKNGVEGINKIMTMKVPPDFVFLDLNIPMINGFDCLRHIRDNNLIPDVPVIIFSTSRNEVDIAKAKELGAVGFFHKPKEIKVLLLLLSDILSVDFKKSGIFFEF